MAWSYRILAEKDGDKVVFQIHEVYLDKNGKPDSYTTNGVTVHSESLQGISSVLDKMRECIDKPILSLEEFPKEYDGETSLVMRDS